MVQQRLTAAKLSSCPANVPSSGARMPRSTDKGACITGWRLGVCLFVCRFANLNREASMVQRSGSRRLATVVAGSLILGAQACSVATPFPEWRVTRYGPVVSARVGRSLQLTSTAAPGGLTFRRLLDRRVTYRLRVVGSQVHGSTVGRLTFGSAEPEWFTAPNGGAFAFNIVNAPSVELVLYSEKPHTYRLDELTIEKCGRCLSDDALRRMLLKERPSLQTDLHQD